MASNTSKVFIDIITQFTGTKSLKQAETSFQKLGKTITKVISVAAIEEFARKSIKAFLADDAAAKQLEKTLTNLGVYFDSGVLSKYIQGLQDTTGVLDDQLRPAFQSLAVATGSYSKSQDLLNVALDVSQGTGKSLAATSTALSRAYLGNFTALSKLGAGISKADIASGDFDLILEKLTKTFKGSAAAAAETYAGKIRILKAAFTDMQETIGKGFVDAFATIVGPGSSSDQLKTTMQDTALATADFIRGLGVIASKFNSIKKSTGFFGELLDKGLSNSPAGLISKLGRDKRVTTENLFSAAPEPAQIGYAKLATDKKAAALAKEEAIAKQKAATAAAKTAKAAADKLRIEKANKILNAAAKVMDIDQAQILAALARDISQEDTDRLKLQQALLSGNAEAAATLAQTVLAANEAALLAEKNNPFGSWDSGLQEVLRNVRTLQTELGKLGSPKVMAPLDGAALLAKDATDAAADAGLGATVPFYVDDFLKRNRQTGQYDTAFQNAIINVMLNPNDLTGAVTKGQQDTTASGIVVGTSRINKFG
jgi:hypothetical protein